MTSLEKKLKELNDSVESYERRSRKRAFIYSLLIPAVLLTFYLGFIVWQISQLKSQKEQLERENSTLNESNLALTRERSYLATQITKAQGEIEAARTELETINQQLAKVRSASDNESVQNSVSEIERRVTNVDSGITSAARNLERYQKTNCGSIIDNSTNLEWFIGPDRNMTWDESSNWVRTLAVCGGQWRLPQISELASLYNEAYTAGQGYFTGGQYFPAHIHPIFDDIGGGSWVWSSETSGSNNAGSYNFNQGVAVEFSRNNTTYSTRVFAVRSR
jgi:cell division protein FtsB